MSDVTLSYLKAVLFDLFGWPSRDIGGEDANPDLVWGDIDNG